MKKFLYYVLVSIIFIVEFPFVLATTIFLGCTYVFNKICDAFSYFNKWIKNKFFPLRNSVVQVKEPTKDAIWTRINDELLTKEDAEKLAKEYEIKGYDTYIS